VGTGQPSASYREDYVTHDRILVLNAGLSKRWQLGAGELRAAFTAGLLGYNMDDASDRPAYLPVMALSLGYQFRLGKAKEKEK